MQEVLKSISPIAEFLNGQPLVQQYLECGTTIIKNVIELPITNNQFNLRLTFENTQRTILLKGFIETAEMSQQQQLQELKTLYYVKHHLAENNVAIQRPLALCLDRSLMGTEFMVTTEQFGQQLDFQYFIRLGIKERSILITNMLEQLLKIHTTPLVENNMLQIRYSNKQVEQCTHLYKMYESKIQTNIEDLLFWLPQVPLRENPQNFSLCHGDLKLNDFKIDPITQQIVAIEGWNLSYIGNPSSDYIQVFEFLFVNSQQQLISGLKGMDQLLGIQDLKQVIQSTLKLNKEELNYYVALHFFKKAVNHQILAKLNVQESVQLFKISEIYAYSGWENVVEQTNGDPFNIKEKIENDKHIWGSWKVTDRAKCLYYRVKDFMKKELFPLERQILDQVLFRTGDQKWKALEQLEALQAKAREQGLWNLFISDPKYGKGLTNLEYTFISEMMGQSHFGHELFNCFAPDTGNIKLLIGYGTEMQKKKYLEPLLQATCKSYFAMSEKDVSSSDPTNFQTTITPVKGGYLVNGKKWYVTGIAHERCTFGIVMGRSPSSDKKANLIQSMIIMDFPNPNIKVIKTSQVFGFDYAPNGLMEVHYDNVFVPEENLLGKYGSAFVMAQGRLVGGRLQHTVRQVGQAARCMGLMMDRSDQRIIFGQKIKEIQSYQQNLGSMEIKLQSCRFMCLNSAMLLDILGGRNYQALKAVSECKAYAIKTTQKIIDDVIQLFGAEGVSYDQILFLAFIIARANRFMDGPCEVHLRQVARFTYGNHLFNDLRQSEGYGLTAKL